MLLLLACSPVQVTATPDTADTGTQPAPGDTDSSVHDTDDTDPPADTSAPADTAPPDDTAVGQDCTEGGGDGTGFLAADGLSALLIAPEGLECAPLVIFGHGADKPGSWLDDEWSDPLGTGLQRLANERSFALLVPGVEEGQSEHGWYLDNCSAFGSLVGLVGDEASIDKNRVYLAGQSAGGFVTAYSTLYCPELFAHTAVVSAGTGGYFDYPAVDPDPKVPVYVVHDPDDQIVPYSQGESYAALLELNGHEVVFEDWELGNGGHSWTEELTPAVLGQFGIP